MYKKIEQFFKSKDVRNNYCKEDEQSTEFRDALDTLD